MNLGSLYAFAAKIEDMKPAPQAHGEGIRTAKAYRETHSALLRPAIDHALAQALEQALEGKGFERDFEAALFDLNHFYGRKLS